MRMINNLLSLTVCMMICRIAICQPANDLCSNATSLDTLPAPAACTGATGLNVGATTSNPYYYCSSCPISITNPPKDVWYSFVASATQLTITVSSATFANPNITLWTGTCSDLQAWACVTGSGDSANLVAYNLTIGNTYLIQIAGDSSQTGSFSLAVHNDNNCGDCFVAGNVVASPPPVNGQYAAGQTVTFCAKVTDWNQTGSNWFHGMVPTFGPGWDTGSLVINSSNAPSSCSQDGGYWAWYPNGEVSTFSGVQWPAGFYYETSSGSVNGVIDNNPGDNYGDEDDGGYCQWWFYVTITAFQNLSPGTDLSVSFATNSDGESGVWSSLGCANDQPLIFNAMSGCGTAHASINHVVCPGDSVLFSGQYINLPGIYLDTAIVSTCDTVITILTLATCIDTVWPGDADNNNVVDNIDILPIGLGYDSTGSSRSVQGNIWQADNATEWPNVFINYAPTVNYAYADCNGDGIIDADDTLAIIQNFGNIHSQANTHDSWRSSIPTLYAIPSSDTLHNGDTLTISFVLGSASMPVDNFYGIAFTYNFDPSMVDPTFTTTDFEDSSWIGAPEQNISLSKIFSAGQIKAAVTRINHTNVSGNGKIAEARFKVDVQGITGLTYANIGSISDIKAINNQGTSIQLNAGIDTTVLIQPTGIGDIITETLRVQPNPAHDKIMISAGDVIRELSITNVMGQQIMNNTAVNSISMNVNISVFDNGIYFVTVKTDRGQGIAKLIVER